MARESLLLIDGHNLVYRAFYAMPALSNSRGEMTNAAFGFTSMLFKALNDHRPTYAIAAFDPPGRTFRHEEFAEYKAQRAATPPELIPQFPWAREIVDALGIPIIEVPSFEADDVIGTLSRKAEQRDLDVIIVTGDLDVLQLVSDRVVVFASRRGISDTIVYDVDKVQERFGFDPPLVVDYKALQGDPSDNIPGVPGIGEKTAKSLVQEYGPLEHILDAIPTMREGRVRRALESHVDQARLSKRTATIRVDMDIDLDLEPARLYHYDEEKVRALFERLEFRSLLARLPGRDGDESNPQLLTRAPDAAGNGQASMSFDAPVRVPAHEVPMVAPQNETTVLRDAHATADAIERIRAAGAMDVRTIVEGNARTGELVAIAFTAPALGTSYYMPLLGSDAVDDAAVAAITAVLADAKITKRGYDLKR
ncbi:MAG TPA: 5'-3' exonuclease H3TH domain-containing protein, partial [Candidatus Acidoferrales bacterium]|nr:5'-3' exonuclease H3TH domain-containing protein [Candidatus Acidoferrales bacterium]